MNEDKYRVGEIYVNKVKNYISYNHPTQKNENGHVKQVTRSIKNYNDEQLELLCLEMDELLKNFNEYTSDFKNINTAKEKFKSKAYEWLIPDEINDNIEQIKDSTLEMYIPIQDKQTALYETKTLIGAIDSVNFDLFRNISDNNDETRKNSYVMVDEINYIIVNDNNLTELKVIAEFKVLADFDEEIINKLVLIYNSYLQNFVDKHLDISKMEELFLKYFDINLNNNHLEIIINQGYEIWNEFCKLNKIKKSEFKRNINFNNFIITRLQNEDINLISLIYDEITNLINTSTSILKDTNLDDISFEYGAYKIKKTIKKSNIIVAKILHFNLNYKDNSPIDDSLRGNFFKLIADIFTCEKGSNSIYKLVKNVRISGVFNTDIFGNTNFNNNCIIKMKPFDEQVYFTKEIMANLELSSKLVLPIDRVFSQDYTLTKLIEKVIFMGYLYKCDFIFLNNKMNRENYNIIKENLLIILSKNSCINQYKYLYCDLILSSLNLQQLTPIEYMYKYDDSYNLICLIENSKDFFDVEVKNYFKQLGNGFVNTKSLKHYIQNILFEAFIKAFYIFCLTPSNLDEFAEENKLYLIKKYNLFLEDNLNYIQSKFEIVEEQMSEILCNLEQIGDYSFYKKTVLNTILAQITIPYKSITEIYELFKFYSI